MAPFVKLLTEGQDRDAVEKLLGKTTGLLEAGETIEHVAVQCKPLFNAFPDGIAVTSKRIIFCKLKNFGLTVEFKTYPWHEVVGMYLKDGLQGADFTVKTANMSETMGYLPLAQAQKLHQFGLARQQEAHEQRPRNLGNSRLGGGGSASSTPASGRPEANSNEHDTALKMSQLAMMLKYRIINQAEYNERRLALFSA
ncbi:PH domain-containing protein [Hymenobacter sp. BT683]|uniref:PH domain-containing protein n=1 Tax=Hymenobacter jeongseonensis TaxID=2791027 RepID=A0ABS0IIV6_9BACT|nr:PH domain-containing protein [Hymenobacter jeongseonensis]MBF9238307.1 PH domain-containing protein [Hymenobacter jeongseonensis]